MNKILNLQNICETEPLIKEKPMGLLGTEKESFEHAFEFIAQELRPKIHIMPEVAKITADNRYIGEALGTVYEFDHKLSETKDNYNHDTFRHSYRMANLSVLIGKALKINKELTDLLIKASILHDRGKVDMDNAKEVLTRKGKLSIDEKRSHLDAINKKILDTINNDENLTPEQINDLKILRFIIGEHHHEDGYWIEDEKNETPNEDIIKLAKLFAKIDKFEAMISSRSYKEGMPEEKVKEILTKIYPGEGDEKEINALFFCYEKLLKNEKETNER